MEFCTNGYQGIAQLGRASAWGAEGRRFNSCYPDHVHGGTVMLEKIGLALTAIGLAMILSVYAWGLAKGPTEMPYLFYILVGFYGGCVIAVTGTLTATGARCWKILKR